ncbi:hypothetical protein LV779_35085 [Streptomyces thinghirensis]|nr:hypothetical protein [Streptomyces thinghirensis]
MSDVFDALPDDARLDVVTFNPPAVSQTGSATTPTSYATSAWAHRCWRSSSPRSRNGTCWPPGGEIYVIASNTADLRALVQHASDHGLSRRIDHLHDWQDGVLTFLFRITHDTPRTGGQR